MVYIHMNIYLLSSLSDRNFFKKKMKVNSQQVLGLYRNLLRYGEQLKLTDQNYFKERVREEFRTNQTITSQEKIEFFFKVSQTCLFCFQFELLSNPLLSFSER